MCNSLSVPDDHGADLLESWIYHSSRYGCRPFKGLRESRGLSLWCIRIPDLLLYPVSSETGTPCRDGLGKLPEIVQVATANLINNIPIDGLVAVHREVPESHSLLHPVGQGRTDHLEAIKRIEVLRHRRRRRDVGVPDEMGGQIDGQLDGPLEIERDDVLQIRILRQVLGRIRRLAGNPFDAASKRFQFGGYEVSIHACLRVAKIRR